MHVGNTKRFYRAGTTGRWERFTCLFSIEGKESHSSRASLRWGEIGDHEANFARTESRPENNLSSSSVILAMSVAKFSPCLVAVF